MTGGRGEVCVGNAVRNHRAITHLARQERSLLDAERLGETRLSIGSATDLPLPDASVDAIVTDPPYYDNVMYAECSDFFFVWFKRAIQDTWPDLISQRWGTQAIIDVTQFVQHLVFAHAAFDPHGARLTPERDIP